MNLKDFIRDDYTENKFVLDIDDRFNKVEPDLKQYSMPFEKTSIYLEKTQLSRKFTENFTKAKVTITSHIKVKQLDPNTMCVQVDQYSNYPRGKASSFFVLEIKEDEEGKVLHKVQYEKENPLNQSFSESIINVIRRFNLSRMEKEYVQATRSKTVKIGKKKFETRRITYVTHKRYVNSNPTYRELEWTHCFSVSGHWRKVKNIGKDRNGDYCVDGYTWVKPCEKNKHLPKIDKLRVLDA